jgi:phosphoribosylaminoimidazolecarboxamide formyltransferase/IMP cyclohydrolase
MTDQQRPDHPRRVTRALLSVSDKSGLTDFARALAGYNIELISTGGTAKAIAEAGLKVKDVSELTGFPEMMDGRVKTLHPKVHGGLLAIRDNKEHASAMKAHGIAPIDLLVVNLYPFEATVEKGADFEECIENIDIGGPAMIRAAAKNHDDVAVVVDASDYQAVLDELKANQGATTRTLRRKLAAKAYARTAAYDAAISNWFAGELNTEAPDFRAFGGRLIQALRYGENPHQKAAFYRLPDKRPGVSTFRQLQGKELSYNNINDTDAAFECVAEFDPARTAACAIIKHANPCGVAEGPDLASAYRKALACDSTSAYGGIIALNRTLDAETARAVTGIFTEVIIAPDATDEAIAIIAGRKNLRLLLTGGLPDPRAMGLTAKTVAGGLLVQGRDNAVVDDMVLKVVTKRAPTEREIPRRQACEVEHDRLRQGSGDRRHRRRPDEPRRLRAHRRAQGAGCSDGIETRRAADQGLGGRLRRLLPLRRRHARLHRSRRHRRDPARGLDPRRRGDQGRRRARYRDGVHGRSAFPALSTVSLNEFCRHMDRADTRGLSPQAPMRVRG